MQQTRDITGIIDAIKERLVTRYHPKKIILFGSYANGRPTTDSDLDLLLIMDTDLPPLERNLAARRAIGPVTIPIDVFVFTPEEFEETKDVIGGLTYAPAKYGRVIYENT